MLLNTEYKPVSAVTFPVWNAIPHTHPKAGSRSYTQLPCEPLKSYDLWDKGQIPFLQKKSHLRVKDWGAGEKLVFVTKIEEKEEQHLGKRKKRSISEMWVEKLGLFLSPSCQNFNTAQQSCAIFVAFIHGSSSNAHRSWPSWEVPLDAG